MKRRTRPARPAQNFNGLAEWLAAAQKARAPATLDAWARGEDPSDHRAEKNPVGGPVGVMLLLGAAGALGVGIYFLVQAAKASGERTSPAYGPAYGPDPSNRHFTYNASTPYGIDVVPLPLEA